jgi:signal peptidase
VKIKKLLQIAIITILVAVTLTFLIFYRPTFLFGDTYYFSVLSPSMEPTIPVGGVVAIKPTDPYTLKVGDIICFNLSDYQPPVTHRIINVTSEGFITKGDANDDIDPWIVKKENVIGKVVFTIPYLGYIGSFVQTPIGFTLLIIIPATLIIIDETQNILNHRNEEKGGEKRNE